MSEEIEILIVEESLSQAAQLKHILEQHNHRVSVEHNGKTALAAMRLRKPRIVISAVLLAGMDGFALCREIKGDENLKDIPVFLLTSLSDTKDVIRGLECGADNFVTKPLRRKAADFANRVHRAEQGVEGRRRNANRFRDYLQWGKVFHHTRTPADG